MKTGPGQTAPLASPPGHPKTHRAKLDSPVRTMLGLIVLWASLLLIFSAHHMSESYIRLEKSGLHGMTQDQSLLQALDSRQTMLLPFSMRLQGTSPRQALTNIAGFAAFKIQNNKLDKLNKERQTYQFDLIPLYKAIHEVVHTPKLGLAVRERELQLFEQQLDSRGTPEHKFEMDWKAELELDRRRLLIIPSGASDLSFSVYLMRDVNTLKPQWNTVQVEVWKGTECLAMAKAALDEKGKAQLSMSAVENIAFSIARQAAPAGDKPGRYSLGFYYQSFE
jgi:hypothetical protein